MPLRLDKWAGSLVIGALASVAAVGLASGVPGEASSPGRSCVIDACGMDDERSGVVFVSEGFDPDDAFRLTGLFSAHWEEPDGDRHVNGPTATTVEEAIAWGRQRARVVLVRLGDDDEHYSAGEERPDEMVRAWPRGGLVVRARPFGSALDGSEQVVTFALASTVRGAAVPLDRLRAGLEADPDVSDPTIRAASQGSVEVRYKVRAAGSNEALESGEEALGAVLEQLGTDPGGAYLEFTAILGTR